MTDLTHRKIETRKKHTLWLHRVHEIIVPFVILEVDEDKQTATIMECRMDELAEVLRLHGPGKDNTASPSL